MEERSEDYTQQEAAFYLQCFADWAGQLERLSCAGAAGGFARREAYEEMGAELQDTLQRSVKGLAQV